MFGFCSHKWGEIKEGYQYCTKCNKARAVNCSHVLRTIAEVGITRDDYYTREPKPIGTLYTQQCTKCGEIIKKRVDVF